MKTHLEIDKRSSIFYRFLEYSKLFDNHNIHDNNNTKNLLIRYYQLSCNIYKTLVLIHQLLQKAFLLILNNWKLISCRAKAIKLPFCFWQYVATLVKVVFSLLWKIIWAILWPTQTSYRNWFWFVIITLTIPQ